MITQNIHSQSSDEKRNTRSSEWAPAAAIDMCNQVRHLPCIYGGTLGDIIDSTPEALISKVMLEDKVNLVCINSGRESRSID
jgi:hypothetical protein